MGDARVGAWMGAWDGVKRLYGFVEEHSKHLPEKLTADILTKNAETLSRLALADSEVGLAVGRLLEQQEESRKQAKKLFEEALGGRSDQ